MTMTLPFQNLFRYSSLDIVLIYFFADLFMILYRVENIYIYSFFFQGVGVAVLRGAVLYGLDPSIVHVRRAMKTYGIGVIKPFIHGEHPPG